jgi:hypothetical protein
MKNGNDWFVCLFVIPVGILLILADVGLIILLISTVLKGLF